MYDEAMLDEARVLRMAARILEAHAQSDLARQLFNIADQMVCLATGLLNKPMPYDKPPETATNARDDHGRSG